MNALLVALDFSSASTRILAAAKPLAKKLGSKLILFHASEPVASYVPVGAAMDVIEAVPQTVIEDTMAAEQKRLDGMAESLRGEGFQVEADVRIGIPADEIVARAEEEGCELIILGSHGHGAIYHLFSGSVVTGVLKKTKVPVFVVPIGTHHQKGKSE